MALSRPEFSATGRPQEAPVPSPPLGAASLTLHVCPYSTTPALWGAACVRLELGLQRASGGHSKLRSVLEPVGQTTHISSWAQGHPHPAAWTQGHTWLPSSPPTPVLPLRRTRWKPFRQEWQMASASQWCHKTRSASGRLSYLQCRYWVPACTSRYSSVGSLKYTGGHHRCFTGTKCHWVGGMMCVCGDTWFSWGTYIWFMQIHFCPFWEIPFWDACWLNPLFT